MAYFTTWCPAGTLIETLVAVEGHRWAIEDSFETAKNELGLAHNETRSWHGWHRHVSLVTLAFAMLAVIRHHANQPTPQKHRSSFVHRRPHPVVDSGNPPHSYSPSTAADPARHRHRLVTLATRSSSRRARGPRQTKSATVMLGRGPGGSFTPSAAAVPLLRPGCRTGRLAPPRPALGWQAHRPTHGRIRNIAPPAPPPCSAAAPAGR